MSTCFPLFDYWLTPKSIHMYWSSITNTTMRVQIRKKIDAFDEIIFFMSPFELLSFQSMYFIWLSIFGNLS